VTSSVPDHVRSIVGRAGSRLTPGGGSSTPVQRRTQLSASQDGAALTVEFTLRGTDRVDAVYALADTDWVHCGEVEVAGTAGADTTYRARVDLAALAAATADHPVVAVAPTRPGSQAGDDTSEGLRLRLFADVTSPSGYVRPLGRVVAWGDDGEVAGADDPEGGTRYRDPLGQYEATDLPVFETVRTDHGLVTPFVNTKGLLCVLVGAPMLPSSQVRNDGLSVARGVLALRGALVSRNTELSSASLIVQGRTSGYQAVVPAAISFDAEATRSGFGLRSYSFTATHDFGPDLASGLIKDDVADMFVEFVPADGSEPYKRRVGRSRFLVRARTRGGHVTHDDVTLSIEPYYTFKAKNPSLHLEIFDAAVHAHLRRQLSTARAVTARRPAKPVWIVGELPYKAQDNGMHFFRHMRENHPEIDAYYVIREDSPERRNLEGLDHVLFYRSTEHIDKVLQAERIVGSHHPDFLYPSRSPRFRRRVRAEKVFLQHGVTGAKWMVPNYGKQVSSFETSLVCVCSEREKQFFVDDFGYAPKEVAVTGFARFDALFADDVPVVDRQILVMPTWRPWLQDPTTFTESDYFHRWHDLLTGPEMRELEERTGAEVVLCLHPNMQQFSHHFSSEHVRVVVQGEVDVQHLIKESAVMVTDYSSVAFDFAFLRKPVIYYQFDAELFDAPHADPQLELPGAVVATQGGILEELEAVAADGWSMSEAYWKRAQAFCRYRDRHNCERIFEAARTLDGSRGLAATVSSSRAVKSLSAAARRNKRWMPTMQRLYKVFTKLPMDSDLIVFESGQGRHFSDSPRYVYEELLRRGDTRTKVWVYDRPLPVSDEHTIVVKRHSFGFYWYLARAKFWVNNHTFPHYITRRPKGQYVQTWHGTPLKRMFLDQEAWFGRDPGYKGRVTEAVRQWSVLVSPSPYATECMRTAYDWTGPVVEVGYPRNDILLDGSAADRATRVRQMLGIAPDKRVVLYAPTFRDDRPTTRGRFEFAMPIDLAEFHRRFGEDHVLLVRTHVLISNRVEVPPGAERTVIDVSTFPDIQELFLASDVLVTDYSSSFFDYSLLGRPVVFYAYDLENYRDNLRGFYLPYDEATLPGPITQTQDELFDVLEASAAVDGPDERVLAFARTYAPNDDGHASARVVDQLL
jgi:CDP-glycerol glycerophosphotransferase